MTYAELTDPRFAGMVQQLVEAERAKALSKREWLHRLLGLGLQIEEGHVVTSRNRKPLIALPPHLCE